MAHGCRLFVDCRYQTGKIEKTVFDTVVTAEQQSVRLIQIRLPAMPVSIGDTIARQSEKVIVEGSQGTLAPAGFDRRLSQDDHRIQSVQLTRQPCGGEVLAGK